jgi:hypothetical protein
VGVGLVGAVSARAAERMEKKTPTAGFYQGKVIHYFDFGAHKTLLRSAADVQRAKAKGLLTTKQTGLVVNCPVVA